MTYAIVAKDVKRYRDAGHSWPAIAKALKMPVTKPAISAIARACRVGKDIEYAPRNGKKPRKTAKKTPKEKRIDVTQLVAMLRDNGVRRIDIGESDYTITSIVETHFTV